jgi:CheY-like chemotaxis protein
MHILLVDDNQDTRELFSMAFVLAGHRTSPASSGVEAIDLFSKYRFDAVLLDLQMPGIDGWTVFEWIRQSPSGKEVPVILFSAHYDPEKEERAKKIGAYALLRKPIFPDHVLAIIESAATPEKA